MSDHHEQPVYRITLRARPDRVPAPKRLAQLLKYALRCQGLVCIEVRAEGQEGTSAPSPNADGAGGTDGR
jgi:hypothetical protein